ncbi:HD domain-containing protein [Desulfovibrio sp. OttesenSCG-928-A18]|nr:HD domain-containing protein [Desulfovibrio sp. OttesenSCG-928-A18]
MNYYVAGGAVRDMLLGRAFRDVDYLVVDSEQHFLQRNPAARKIQSVPAPIYLLHGQEYTVLDPAGQGPEAMLHQDLLRRDFTINALLLSESGILRAHRHSFADLREKRLRPASATALADDPVRIFRAARFAAMLPDFSVHEDVLVQMRAAAQLGSCAAIAAEQVGKECLKALACARPGNFLRLLQDTGCLGPWFAELEGADSIPAGPERYHSLSVFGHSARLMDSVARTALDDAAGERERCLAVWMALCHDLGKCATPGEMLPRHIGHEKRGISMARDLGLRLRLPRLYIRAGEEACALHMKGGIYPGLRPGTRVDLLMRLHGANPAFIRPFCRLAAADSGNAELPDIILRDYARILAVRLPRQWRDLGAESGRQLRELRCAALV